MDAEDGIAAAAGVTISAMGCSNGGNASAQLVILEIAGCFCDGLNMFQGLLGDDLDEFCCLCFPRFVDSWNCN